MLVTGPPLELAHVLLDGVPGRGAGRQPDRQAGAGQRVGDRTAPARGRACGGRSSRSLLSGTAGARLPGTPRGPGHPPRAWMIGDVSASAGVHRRRGPAALRMGDETAADRRASDFGPRRLRGPCPGGPAGARRRSGPPARDLPAARGGPVVGNGGPDAPKAARRQRYAARSDPPPGSARTPEAAQGGRAAPSGQAGGGPRRRPWPVVPGRRHRRVDGHRTAGVGSGDGRHAVRLGAPDRPDLARWQSCLSYSPT